MSLAEKIALIDQEYKRVEDQFNKELNAGLVQYHAMKTKEETDARNEEIRQQGIDERIKTTATDITTTKTDLGEEKISKNIHGDPIKTETVIDDRTVETVSPKFEEIKSGNEIITYRDGVEVARTPRWQVEQTGTKGKTYTKWEDRLIGMGVFGFVSKVLPNTDGSMLKKVFDNIKSITKGKDDDETSGIDQAKIMFETLGSLQGETLEEVRKELNTKTYDLKKKEKALKAEEKKKNWRVFGGGEGTPDKELIETLEAEIKELKKLKKIKTTFDTVFKKVKSRVVEKKEETTGELEIGFEEDGYKYIGGDPSKETSWEKIK